MGKKTLVLKNFRAQFDGDEARILDEIDTILKKYCGANWAYDFDVQE